MIQTKVEVIEKSPVNHDCYRMRLKFTDQKFQIKIGQSIRIDIMLKTKDYPEGMNVSRKYSIISPSSVKDYFDIIFKVYRSCEQFPEGGQMTQYLQKEVHVGDLLDIEGPFSRFQYLGQGRIFLNGDEYGFKKIFLMAGGSGITPCYQTLKQLSSFKDQTIELQLLFANKTEQDIILRNQLEQMSPKVKIHYLVEKPTENWTGLTGLVTTQLLEKLCVLNDPQTLYIHCGPVGMTKVIVLHFLKNYAKMKLFKF